MAAPQSPSLLLMALNDGLPDSSSPPFGRLLLASLVLHVVLLLTVNALRLSDSGPSPLVSQEVALVSVLELNRSAVQPARRPVQSKPRPRMKQTPPPPVPATESPTTPAVARPRAEDLMREAINSIKLPPSPKPEAAPRTDAAARQTPAPKPVTVPAMPPSRAAEAKAESQALMERALSGIKLPPRRVPAAQPSTPASSRRVELPDLPDHAPAAVAKESETRSSAEVQAALEGIELPPQTPKFEKLAALPDVNPTTSVPQMPSPTNRGAESAKRQVQQDVDAILGELKVPELSETLPAPSRQPRSVQQRRSVRAPLSEDVRKELREIEKRRRTVAPETSAAADRPTSPDRSQASSAQQAPAVAALEEPKISIRATDVPSGASEYLARVQRKISKQWVAPPVELTRKSLVVIIKFRLFRAGTVSNVIVEQSSGNEYYDLAAKRAVISAEPLPEFPRGMSEFYVDAHFTFAVGEGQVG